MFLFIPSIMSDYIPSDVLDEIQEHTKSGQYEKAVELVNSILVRDPKNEEALLMITDILYRQGDMEGADKALSFLNSTKKDDPLGLYIKGLLEMEKNNWKDARSYLRKAMQLTNGENHEIIRCYGLSEYWYGNREKGRNFVRKAFKQNSLDAEIIYNIVQLAILDEDYEEAIDMIQFFHSNRNELKIVDKSIGWYDKKIALFEKFINGKKHFNLEK